MEYLITLVHGTFAPRAPWTRTSSNFCKKLRKSLGKEDSIEFKTFDWTGSNSNSSRFKAAKELTIMLKDQERSCPNKKKVIIAHSHGGNISMYALKKLGEGRRAFKLVTMATPFLNSKARNYENHLNTHLVLLSILFGFIAYLILGMVGFWIISNIHVSFIEDDTKYVLYFFVLIVLMLFSLENGKKIHQYLKKQTEKLPEELQEITEQLSLQDFSCNYPILSVVDHSDEVKLWFDYLYRFWEITLNFYGWLTSVIKWLMVVFVVILTVVLSGTFFNVPDKTADFIFLVSIFSGNLLLTVIFAVPVLTIFIPFLFLFIRSNPAALGWESWKSRMFIKTTPSTTPLGYPNLTFIQYDLKRNALLSLKHSIYEHDLVIDNILTWIRK